MTTLSETSPHLLAPEPTIFQNIKAVLFGRPGTIIAVVIIAVLIVVAVLAPVLAPYDPLTQSMLKINRTQAGKTGLAPTSSVAMCSRA